jgi:hypothetical protein
MALFTALPTLPQFGATTGAWLDNQGNPTNDPSITGIPAPIAPARPATTQQGNLDPFGNVIGATTTPQTTAPPVGSPAWITAATAGLENALGSTGLGLPLGGAVKVATTPPSTLLGLVFTSRLMFLIIGLLLIGAGVFAFKTTQTVIETGTKVVKGAAALAA